MCLAIPGKIISINAAHDELIRTAKVSFGGIFKEINIYMVPEVKIGDYILAHVGIAIAKIDENEALKTLDFLSDSS